MPRPRTKGEFPAQRFILDQQVRRRLVTQTSAKHLACWELSRICGYSLAEIEQLLNVSDSTACRYVAAIDALLPRLIRAA